MEFPFYFYLKIKLGKVGSKLATALGQVWLALGHVWLALR